jgi:hypothetical protein
MCAVLFGLVGMNRMVAQHAQEDKPVEQTRKNIQVLKGLPESQLFPLMNFMATSIGVKCDYCHVNKGKTYYNGDWVWESDEKPKKLVGRRMMQMVLDINRANFNGETSVTCYTCHRESTVVARQPPSPPHDPTVRTETAALPTAAQILTKYFSAIGGTDAVAKLKTTVMKGKIERSENRVSEIEVTLKDADKYLVTQTTPQGAVMLGINGETGWFKRSTGSRQLSGRTLEGSRRAVVLYYAPIKVLEQPEKMKVLGTEKIGDREAYVVTLVVDPDTTKKFFFDTQTGLLLRHLTNTRTMLGPLPEQVDYEDYRDVDGIKLPFTVRTSDTATYATSTYRYTEIKHNVTVSDAIFNLPAAPQ